MTAAATSTDPDLIDAILDDRLSSWARNVLDDSAASDAVRRLASLAATACSAIHDANRGEADRLIAALADDGISAEAHTSDQRHSIRLDIEPDDVAGALETLRRVGLSSNRHWTGSAARSFHRFAGATTLTKSGTQSTVVRLRWRTPRTGRSRFPTTLRKAITPTPADWAMIDLPAALWWAYGVLRPVRLVAERLGVMSNQHGDLEPFLVTPDALLEPLFAVAELGAADVFADIGCGDGRIVTAAAQRHGCRALGVEQSAELVAAARQRVDAAGVSDRVDIVHADAHDADLTSVTAALLFVPMVVASRLLPTLSERFAPGARIVLHEQSRLPATLPESSHSVAIIAPEAVTVAHRWDP